MAMAGVCGKCREGCLLFFVVLVDEVRRGRRPKGDRFEWHLLKR